MPVVAAETKVRRKREDVDEDGCGHTLCESLPPAYLVDDDEGNGEDACGGPSPTYRHTAMIDDWFSAIELPITWQQFWQLPQNPAYKYEYFDGHAWLSPMGRGHGIGSKGL